MAQSSNIEWQMKPVKILVTNREDESRLRRTWALVSGNMAIHTTTTIDGFDWGLYNLTHIPTGLRIGPAGLEKSMLGFYIEKYQDMKWRGIKILDMPACEIATAFPLMCSDLLPQWWRDPDEEAATQQAVIELHNCKEVIAYPL